MFCCFFFKLTVSLYCVNASFSADQICSVIDTYAVSLSGRSDRDKFYIQINPIVELLRKYTHGIKGRMRGVIVEMFAEYLRVEGVFQGV